MSYWHKKYKHTHRNVDEEHWADAFGGLYKVSCLGRFRSNVTKRGTRKGKLLKLFKTPRGYSRVIARVNGKYVYKFLHRLVARKFIGKSPTGYHVNHKDFDITNNRWDNLEYLSPGENTKYSKKHGRYKGVQTGELNGNAILTKREVEKIRNHWDYSSSEKDYVQARRFAKKYNISRSSIVSLIRRETWK